MCSFGFLDFFFVPDCYHVKPISNIFVKSNYNNKTGKQWSPYVTEFIFKLAKVLSGASVLWFIKIVVIIHRIPRNYLLLDRKYVVGVVSLIREIFMNVHCGTELIKK